MNAFRGLGALLCIACVVVVVLHIGIGYWRLEEYLGVGPMVRPNLAFALPVTAMVLVVCGLGFWLGWIMATTKEVAPTPPPTPPEPAEEVSEEDVIDVLTSVDGVTEARARALIDIGFTDLESLRRASADDLTEAKGIGPSLAERIKDRVRE